MINPHYDHESDYHSGSPVESDAKAWLGPWKSIEDVSPRYRLQQYADIIDAEDSWEAFCDEYGDDWSENTRKYVYGKAWKEWTDYCDKNNIHPACPEPANVENHLSIQQDSVSTDKTLHDVWYRPLFRWWEWMRYHVDYPVRYNPALMAVLFNGATADAWQTRVSDRLWQQQLREKEAANNE